MYICIYARTRTYTYITDIFQYVFNIIYNSTESTKLFEIDFFSGQVGFTTIKKFQ